VFASADRVSGALNDFQLRLTLAPGANIGPPVTVSLTAVSLTLDVFMSRTVIGSDPAPLPQPAGGRFIHVQNPPGNHHGRAMVEVTMAPVGVNARLVLRRVGVSAADVVGAVDNKMVLFDNENPTGGETVHPGTLQFDTSTLSGTGKRRFFAQGRAVSGVLRDTGFQLGIVLAPGRIENDGDRVRLTVVQFRNLVADVPSTGANTARPNPPGPAAIVNTPVARHNFDITNFAEDFALTSTLVLVEDSVLAADLINLSVQVRPANVPVQWSMLRDTTAGTGDGAAVIALKPAPALPTLTPSGVNQLQATLLADHVGSFFIRAFVDSNGNNAFDRGIDKEPFILMNLVLIRVAGVTNASVANPPANVTTLRTGTRTPTLATTAGFNITTGNVAAAPGGDTFNNPTVAAVHNDATILVIGGGPTGVRGLDRLMAGWTNNELPVATSPTVPLGEDIVADYVDIAPPPPARTHRRFSIWVAPGGIRTFLPANANPTLVAGPFLDVSNTGNAGTGGNTVVGTEGDTGPPVVPPGPPGPPPQRGIVKTPVAAPGIGQNWRIRMWDSPGDAVPAAHGGFPGTLLRYNFNLDFRCDLCVWTNVTGVPGPTNNAAARLYSSVQTNTWTIRFEINVALVAPARPTLGSVAGGPLVARTNFVQVTYVTAAGETVASAESTLAITAGRRLRVASPAVAAGATGYNVYVGNATGTETRQNAAPIPIGTSFTEPATGLVAGAAPPAVSTAGALAAPGAPAVTAIATAATTFFVRVSYVNARGETTVSPAANFAVPAGRLLRVNSPVAFGDATGYNAYIGNTAATVTRQNAAPVAIGTAFTMPATGLIAGAALPAANTTGGAPIANAVTLTQDGNPTRQATPVQGSGLEVRRPAALDMLATNART
jgi:hypothetical protein